MADPNQQHASKVMDVLTQHGIEIRLSATGGRNPDARRVTVRGSQPSSGRSWGVILEGRQATPAAAIRAVLQHLVPTL